jgi:small subunit ribosomal protein S20
MANTRSAAKQARVALRRRSINQSTKSAVKGTEKQIRSLVKEGKKAEALKLYLQFQGQVDKASKKNALHRNKASRSKSRLAKLLK